jgi:hypothetical protein
MSIIQPEQSLIIYSGGENDPKINKIETNSEDNFRQLGS